MPCGGVARRACNSCKAIAEDNPSAPNDWYWVDIDGSVTSVYCDIEAGGWTQCFEVENTFADDFGTSNDWMDNCVDLTMGSWSGNEVRVTLIDPSGDTIYDEYGDRPTTWTYDQLTSTTYSGRSVSLRRAQQPLGESQQR